MGCLKCTGCKNEFPLDEKIWKCKKCGGLLDIEFEAKFPKRKIGSRKPTMWRYLEAIPVSKDSIISFGEGFTPLVEVEFEGKKILIKQDHLFPTGSYKDRGASILMSKAREIGIKRVVEDSSGNAGCAIAAYSANAGIDCEIFVPEDTASGKLAQIQYYGAKLNRVPGSREDTARAVLEAAKRDYYASHSWNPFFFHGTKTFAFEVCEQLGWKAPDTVVVPAGNGTLLLGVYIGFDELMRADVIDKVPKIIGVQTESCPPLYKAFKENLGEIPKIQKKDGLAEGIAIAEPVRGKQILEAIRKTRGDFIAVPENEIGYSLKEVCKRGFYIEPTSAATIAGLRRYLQNSDKDEVVVSVFTGHGLKTTEKMLKLLEH